jgi:hypothetical protein
LGVKTSGLGRPIALTLLISAQWRYGQRWTRRRRVIRESLRSIGRKFFWGFTKYRKATFQDLVGHRNGRFFEKHLLLYMNRCSSTSWFEISLWFCVKMPQYSKTNDFGAEIWFSKKPLALSLFIGATRRYSQQ